MPELNAGARAPHHIAAWKVTLVLLLLALAVVGLWFTGNVPRLARERAADTAALERQTSLPQVTAARVRLAPRDSDLSLPGSISPATEASIYARAAGYVRKRLVDVGDKVKEGQLMAEIETPELDQQVAQARAAVAQARQQLTQTRAAVLQAESQRDLARLTSQRYDALVKRGAIARQDADQQETGYKTAEALVQAQQAIVGAAEENVAQAQANLDRVLALQDYKNVRAPFAGVVTARNIEVGYLISSNGGGLGASPLSASGSQNTLTGNEMFRVAQVATLRIVISVPQTNAPGIAVGTPAQVLVNEFPGRVFAGKIARTANALDPSSRTLQTQIEIPNRDGKLMPGMYATVRLRTHRDVPPVIVPGDAIITGTAGTQVAILQDLPSGSSLEELSDIRKKGAQRIHLQTVQPGRDYGPQTEIVSGLQGSELVIVNPGDAVREGNLVKAEVRADAAAGRGAQQTGRGAQNNGANRK
jgi:multidrug efflux pump subunit AcrA (membrane-fusion protein)